MRYLNFHCFPGKKSVAQRSQGTSSRSPSCDLGARFSASQLGSTQHAGRGTEKKMGRSMLESNGDRTEAEGRSRCILSWGRIPPRPRPEDRSPSWLKAGAPSWHPQVQKEGELPPRAMVLLEIQLPSGGLVPKHPPCLWGLLPCRLSRARPTVSPPPSHGGQRKIIHVLHSRARCPPRPPQAVRRSPSEYMSVPQIPVSPLGRGHPSPGPHSDSLAPHGGQWRWLSSEDEMLKHPGVSNHHYPSSSAQPGHSDALCVTLVTVTFFSPSPVAPSVAGPDFPKFAVPCSCPRALEAPSSPKT